MASFIIDTAATVTKKEPSVSKGLFKEMLGPKQFMFLKQMESANLILLWMQIRSRSP